MVISTDSDIYTPFPQGIMMEDGPQSSEDGSGLHSPIFGAQFPQPHGDIRYHQDQLDIQHAAGILASQFDYTNINIHPHPHLLETPLNLHSNQNPHHHNSYQSEFPLPQRNHLGLDIPPHAYPNTRLPPPPAHGGAVNLSYQGPPNRRYSAEDLRPQSYSSGGGSTQPPVIQTPESTRSSVPTSESTPQPQPAASTSQDPPRREISNQVIACRQCRARKIRCDSTRPICHNCVRRSNECQYDAAPKRRGPDKRPGTRQRSCKKRPTDGSSPPSLPSKRKRTSVRNDDFELPRESRGLPNVPALRPDGDRIRLQPSLSPTGPDFSSSMQTRAASDDSYPHQVEKYRIPSTPSVQYSRKEWWDNLVMSYSTTRDQSLKDIASDLSTLFTTSGYWLSFVNVPDFVHSLYNPEERSLMQPSLVFAGLALATLMKSSEMELGSAGRERAVWLRDKAQAWLEASLNSQWIDMTLAKAALIIAVYESSAHPHYTSERARRSLAYLDGIVRQLGLTFLDGNEPDVSTFTPNAVPIAHRRRPFDQMSKDGVRTPHAIPRKCDCIPLPNSSIATEQFSSSWSSTLPWDPSWTPEEMHKESCRRLCWSALNLVARYTSHCIAFQKEPSDLFLTDPSNFRLLFPGEISQRGSNEHKAQSPKESIWALYCRSMLLWNFCTTRLRKNVFSSTETTDLAVEAWSETLEIQDALDTHTCNLDMALLYMCREYVYNTQIIITQLLQAGHAEAGNSPQFNRKQAEQWLYYQTLFIRRVKMSIHHLGDQDGHLFTRQPFQVTWFASQVATCLSLWEEDKSLLDALEVAKDVIMPVDVLNTLWPCPMLLSKCDDLRKRVTEACHTVNIVAPLPPNCSLPPLLRGGP
ncbi:uncharacterized protein BJ212DRAFT_1371289 [Suillus subaureus]|uniref:Zn(2)-C6 fungal-type domain-containing protein n=1 Tax=Suillus subaureus TaxID=48587 RepID=A0A9P7E5P1_9AGAM|nr:uncharacterized protein BJ212DRAFT_1371289 [Suillus subaureus]KAG1812086.1 hypothetical protein BJ212DRAFT_1371289 [Suillus subaureus]